jgi:spermidine synthase
VIIGPAVFCMATALPWFLEEHPEPGATARLYALNTLGSVAGSLLAAWGLLPLFGTARSAWLLALLLLGVSALLHASRQRWIVAATAAAALGFAAAFASSPGRDRMLGLRDFGGHHVIAHEEDADFTASVIDTPDRARVLYIDGFSATSDDPVSGHYMRWMGSLPALLHPDPVRGLVICFGTGQTADALRRELRGRLDVVEISRAVLDLAPLFEANHDVLGDPDVEAIVMDGRAWLRRSDRRYDVITLEPMPPNFSGVNALYSREFYAIAARRLAPGGIVAQWLPIHLLSLNHAASVAATFRSVFPDAVLWIDPADATGILLGRLDGAAEPLGTSWPGLARGAEGRNLSGEQIRNSLLLDRDALARYASGVPLVTDDNQLLQFSDLRAGLRGERSARLSRANRTILSQLAGRPIYRVE